MTESRQDPPPPGGHIPVEFRFPGCDFPAEVGGSGGRKIEGDEARVRPRGGQKANSRSREVDAARAVRGIPTTDTGAPGVRGERGISSWLHCATNASIQMPPTCEAQAKLRLVHGNATCPRFSKWIPSLHLCKSPFLAGLSDGTGGDEARRHICSTAGYMLHAVLHAHHVYSHYFVLVPSLGAVEISRQNLPGDAWAPRNAQKSVGDIGSGLSPPPGAPGPSYPAYPGRVARNGEGSPRTRLT